VNESLFQVRTRGPVARTLNSAAPRGIAHERPAHGCDPASFLCVSAERRDTLGWHAMKVLPLLLALLLISSTASASQTACYQLPFPPGEVCREVLTIPVAWTRCAVDSDCILVPWDCCGCNAAGISIAISRDFLKQHASKYAGRCHDYLPGAKKGLRCPEEWVCDFQGNAVFCNASGLCEFGFR
jgi:hypothetical protein